MELDILELSEFTLYNNLFPPMDISYFSHLAKMRNSCLGVYTPVGSSKSQSDFLARMVIIINDTVHVKALLIAPALTRD